MKSLDHLHSKIAALLLFICLVAMDCACTPSPPSEGVDPLRQMEEGAATREAYQAEFGRMDITQLIEHLETDSIKGVEPFNSVAYHETVSRGQNIGEALTSSIKTPDRTSFLTLLALREVDKNLYHSFNPEIGAAILVDALQTSKTFNAWGLPHLYWEDAAEAIIEYGDIAIEPLRNLLNDDREAPVWGSEEALESDTYKFRVKDYAWALLMEIQGEEPEIPVDPAERDNLIAIELRQ